MTYLQKEVGGNRNCICCWSARLRGTITFFFSFFWLTARTRAQRVIQLIRGDGAAWPARAPGEASPGAALTGEPDGKVPGERIHTFTWVLTSAFVWFASPDYETERERAAPGRQM